MCTVTGPARISALMQAQTRSPLHIQLVCVTSGDGFQGSQEE